MNFLVKKLTWGFILLISLKTHAQITESMSTEAMEKNLAKIAESIRVSKSHISKVRDARFLPELYFALAEFYTQKSRYMYALKLAKNKTTDASALDFSNEKRPKFEAIGVYDRIIEKFPHLPSRDKALFFKAHEQRELGLKTEMIISYSQLTREYPQSKYWAESQIIIGDYFFEEKQQLDKAEAIFKKVIQRPLNVFTPLAYFKLGWCYINKAQFENSLRSFEKVLVSSRKIKLEDLPELYKKTDVRRDALMKMVWPYSELSLKRLAKMGGGRSHPLKYFYRLSPDRSSYEKVLTQLARRMDLKHKYQMTTQIYFEILRMTTNFEQKIDIIERLYVSMKNTHKKWPLRGFNQEVAKVILDVRNNTQLTSKQRQEIIHNFEIYSRDIATRSHRRAKKTQKLQDWKWAVEDYKAYLWSFPNSNKSYALEVNLAESYFLSGNLLEAAKLYEKISRKTRSRRKLRSYLNSAIEAYIGSIRNQSELNLLEKTEVQNGLRTVGNLVIRKFPKSKLISDIKFNIAQTYYDERRFKEAIRHLKSFVLQYPSSKHISTASHLMLDAYNQKEDYSGLIAMGQLIIRNKSIRHSHLKRQIYQIVEQARVKSIQQKAGDYDNANYTRNLLKIAAKYKGSKLGDRALYEAFKAQRGQKSPKAYRSGEQLVLQHERSKYAQEVISSMGQMALQTADFRRATVYFELYHEKYPRNKDAKQLLLAAAKIREASGDYKIAARNYRALGDSYNAARMDWQNGDWAALQRSAQGAGGFYAAYWEGVARYRLRGLSQARRSLKKAIQLAGSSYSEKEGAAHALYLLSAGALEQYRKIQIKRGREAKAVNNKSSLLISLTRQLNTVISYGNERWSIAALYSLGKANKEFARFIKKAPLPKKLSSSDRKLYQKALQRKAQKYLSVANTFFRQCIVTASKYEVFTEFVRGCSSKGKYTVNEARDIRVVSNTRAKSTEATEKIKKQLFDSPENIKLLSKLALIYKQKKDYSMAELILNRILEISPKNSATLAKLGVIKIYRNQLTDARNLFKKSIQFNESQGLAYRGLAGLYEKYRFHAQMSKLKAKLRVTTSSKAWHHPWMNVRGIK